MGTNTLDDRLITILCIGGPHHGVSPVIDGVREGLRLTAPDDSIRADEWCHWAPGHRLYTATQIRTPAGEMVWILADGGVR